MFLFRPLSDVAITRRHAAASGNDGGGWATAVDEGAARGSVGSATIGLAVGGRARQRHAINLDIFSLASVGRKYLYCYEAMFPLSLLHTNFGH